LADRNFCTTGFLFGIRRRGAFFVIRQHTSTLSRELPGKRRLAGKDGRGRDIYEQAIRLTDAETGDTFTARRITMSSKKFGATLVELARRLDPRKYIKHNRGPKRKQPKKISGKTTHHVSTARILAMRK
jgi:hypothetical protein